MALKPCRECKKKVSTQASTCPSCGVPNPTAKNTKNNNPKVVLPSDGFWSGNKGLAVSFWGYFIGGNILANFFYFIAFNNGGGEDLIGLVLLGQVIWVFLCVFAIFNSATIYKGKKINAGEPYGWATTAKVVTVILILSAIGNSLKYFR
jgi:hypothetical protein